MFDSKMLTPLSFLVVAGIIFWGGVWQQIGALQSLSTQLAQADAAVKQAQGGKTERDQLVATWQNLDTALKDRVELGLPTTNDLPNALALLNDTAASSGLLVENINVLETPQSQSTQNPAAGAAAPVVPSTPSFLLGLTARGDYPSMKAFSQSIQREERIMDLQSITISPAASSGGQASPAAGQSKIFELAATVKVYYGK